MDVIGCLISYRHSPIFPFSCRCSSIPSLLNVCVPWIIFWISRNTLLPLFRTLIASLRICCCRPFADAPPISCEEVIRKVLRWFYRIAATHISVALYKVILSSVFFHMHDDALYGVVSGFFVVFVDIVGWSYESARMTALRFDPLRRLLFFDLAIYAWIFWLTRFVRVDISACHGRSLSLSIVGVTPIALCHFARGRMIFILDDRFLAFHGASFFI